MARNYWLLPTDVLTRAENTPKLVGDFIESLLDPETREITALDPVDILARVREGTYTAVKVTTAFCKRAPYAHQLNNNVLEFIFEAALEQAKELDQYLEQHNETAGPLHGLPVSMKNQFHVNSVNTSMGYVGWINKERPVESLLVKELKSLGAIPIAKTTCVQTLFFGETNNNILGYTKNPFNQALSTGGSSGGEGAFQALRGSGIGFGTDIGGSVIMPSAFAGLYSLKPSHGRISYKDVANSVPGQPVIPSVIGIMAISLPSLRLMFKSLQSTKPWLDDPEVINFSSRLETEPNSIALEGSDKVSFGLYENDGMVVPHPPIQRALRIVQKALDLKGYKFVTWDPPSHREAATMHSFFLRADGNADVFEQINLSGEPFIPEIQAQFGEKPKPPALLLDFYKQYLHLKECREKYQAYWNSTATKSSTGLPVDAVILPASPHAGVIPGKYYHYLYSNFPNVLDYTTMVIPVTNANKTIDIFDKDYKPLNDVDKKNWLAYDPEKYNGAPASFQLLGRRLDEEKLISLATIIVEALEEYKKQDGWENV
ncbi:amidase [Mollisia scopiformis]|uniref:Amidase n=1 Tax=Mollisia scopiformis TaxID=149040 RepID=A0A194WW23_MOLSC|nr:amidase [Mollisia scopiformis]KUJ12171.1 amidase [Mollisia scopiformis]